MVIVDRSGHTVLVNSQAERLFGYAREELIGKGIEVFAPERFRDFHPRHRTQYSAIRIRGPWGPGWSSRGDVRTGVSFR